MGNQRDSLGDRMKRYEYVSRNYLTRRVRNINWNDFPTDCKRGSCCIKTRITEAVSVLNGDATVEVSRSRWVVDREPPVFTQDREYVERRL